MKGYRPDVDGLRAIAVLSVVVYHMRESILPGGFTGVDIFFVISGYLITGLIAKELATNEFSIARFYVRRAKRILPALFTVLLVTTLLSLVLLVPSEIRALGRTLGATAAFISNIVFWQDIDYFDVGAHRKPLLHTWSLAVEEQFYVIWPILLMLIARIKPLLRPAVAIGIGLSFLLSCYAALEHPPSAFFLLPSRAWELLAGAALALGFVPTPRTEQSRNVAAVTGLALIAIGVSRLDSTSAFPGWNALWPCLGALLIIAAGETGSNAVRRFVLERRPVIFIGLISYSLYLWHWPLLVLARIAGRGALDLLPATVIVAIAIGLSILTWHFIERPFRAGAHTPAATPVLVRYAMASLAMIAVGVVLQRPNGVERFASPEIIRADRARFETNPLSASCLRWQADRSELPGDECVSPIEHGNRRVVLWGDSHADAVAPAFVESFKGDFAVHQLTMAGCPPLVDVHVTSATTDYEPCEIHNRKVLEYATTDSRVEAVVLSARWPLYTDVARFGDDPGPIVYLLDGHDSPSIESFRKAFTKGLSATLDALVKANRRVIVLGTIPAVGFNVPECIARNYMPFSSRRDCRPELDAVRTQLAYAETEIQRQTSNRPGVCAVYPVRAICPDGGCITEHDGKILYANDDHLSLAGALYLSNWLDHDQCLGAKPTDQVAAQ